jgi:hypothetical protein
MVVGCGLLAIGIVLVVVANFVTFTLVEEIDGRSPSAHRG